MTTVKVFYLGEELIEKINLNLLMHRGHRISQVQFLKYFQQDVNYVEILRDAIADNYCPSGTVEQLKYSCVFCVRIQSEKCIIHGSAAIFSENVPQTNRKCISLSRQSNARDMPFLLSNLYASDISIIRQQKRSFPIINMNR